jgi:hypothetical protein
MIEVDRQAPSPGDFWVARGVVETPTESAAKRQQ